MKTYLTLFIALALASCGKNDNVPAPSGNEPKPSPLPYYSPEPIVPPQPPIPASPANVEGPKGPDLSSLFYKKIEAGKFQFLSNRNTRGNWTTGSGQKLYKKFGICADLALTAGNTFMLQVSAVRWETEEECTKNYENLDTLSIAGSWAMGSDGELQLTANVTTTGYTPFVSDIAKIKIVSASEVSLAIKEDLQLYPYTYGGRDTLSLKSATMLLRMTTSKTDIGTFQK